ncbi:hypothetical protein [Ruegeria sp. EL01]|jgi:hypothetical protein|uniref:hypothetical protein n=1 Tax=Ruegeria sp. EL01 TaxID=2107578 RepID=UPI0020B14AA8|nr:hypothetical protein [Ruegeria sp. EL01]
MRYSKLSNLKSVTEAVFQKQFQTLRPVLEAEANIQQQLVRLDTQVKQARQDGSKAEGYRVTGTDMLWHGWESATRRQLNLDLARLRAQKREQLDALKAAFGRKEAIARLSSTLLKDHRRDLAKKQSNQ